ncbi:MAG: nitrate ABC transporter permease [Gammaproteobacteria bacterium RIFCSPLOWO2_12_47_11]|nr:MAG: nitrate ABC transporter permease [Gammaproteobacteria bacterium RIFCSPLOWO2_12_47_11]
MALSTRIVNFLELTGLTWGIPITKLCAGDDPAGQIRELWKIMGIPVIAFVVFLVIWDWSAAKVQTSLGAIPGPAAIWSEAVNLLDEHYTERGKETGFYDRQKQRNTEILAKDPGAEVRIRPYTGKPTYLDQILTSLWTVFTGFFLASIIAIPVGVLCGLSSTVNTALNPLIQIFKPVSPLAWLPIVTLVVSAVYVTENPMFQKAFITSAITVTLCSLWPALINTAVGVASIDKDLMNVSRVLQLSWFKTVTKIVLPSALPLIFTGLRLSLGVGWMVLIASEMLAQNPGLGKFVWDEFQNGSSQSLGRIMVAVFTIGVIGFLLDRIMMTLQKFFSFGKTL